MERLQLKITEVSLMLETGDLKKVDLDGRKDILNHPEVRRYTRDYAGRIITIGGEIRYHGHAFKFNVGYTPEGFGKIRVEKKGGKSGNPEVNQSAFNFLYELYKQFFFI